MKSSHLFVLCNEDKKPFAIVESLEPETIKGAISEEYDEEVINLSELLEEDYGYRLITTAKMEGGFKERITIYKTANY